MANYAPQRGGLVITRVVGEELIIGEGINECVIVVESAAGGRTQLRILADRSIPIHKAEVRWEIRGDER